jgi:hypothetical protein
MQFLYSGRPARPEHYSRAREGPGLHWYLSLKTLPMISYLEACSQDLPCSLHNWLPCLFWLRALRTCVTTTPLNGPTSSPISPRPVCLNQYPLSSRAVALSVLSSCPPSYPSCQHVYIVSWRMQFVPQPVCVLGIDLEGVIHSCFLGRM